MSMNVTHNLQASISHNRYVNDLRESVLRLDEYKKNIPDAEMQKYRDFKRDPEAYIANAEKQKFDRFKVAKGLIQTIAKSYWSEEEWEPVRKAGVTTANGYNFYDLRGPVEMLYPVNTPFRNSLPRMGNVNAGVGQAAHWNATRNPGIVYVGVTEGQRNAVATPDNIPFVATYKEIGVERAATFTSQFAAAGFTDVVADEHVRGLAELALQEEGMMLVGNSGVASGNNGFVLGTCPTPSASLANPAVPPPANGGFAAGTTVSVACVLLTAMGNPPPGTQHGYTTFPSVQNGLTPFFTRNNADGSTDTINGGTSAISALSTAVTTTAANGSVTVSVPNVPKGAFGYAWFVNSVDNTLGNAKLAAITSFNSFTVNGPATGAQTGTAAGLNTDHSFNSKDFDGLLTYAASTPGAQYYNLNGASLTSTKGGQIVEFETVLSNMWLSFQANPQAIWCSSDVASSIDRAIKYGGSGNGGIVFQLTRDQQGNVMGGFSATSYLSRYAMNGATMELPIKIHPMLPVGTVYFDVSELPYANTRAPFVRGMLLQRDYYSIEWPVVTRSWTFGTYCHEVLAHQFPWLSAVITGIGQFNQSN